MATNRVQAITAPDYIPENMEDIPHKPIPKRAEWGGGFRARPGFGAGRKRPAFAPEPAPVKKDNRVFSGPVRISIPLVLDGEQTDYGYALEAVYDHNLQHGDGADLPSKVVAMGAAVSWARSYALTTGLYRAGLVDIVKDEGGRAMPVTDKGRTFIDGMGRALDPEENMTVAAEILRPTRRIEDAIRNALDEDPDASMDDLMAAAGTNFPTVATALLYVDPLTKVVR